MAGDPSDSYDEMKAKDASDASGIPYVPPDDIGGGGGAEPNQSVPSSEPNQSIDPGTSEPNQSIDPGTSEPQQSIPTSGAYDDPNNISTPGVEYVPPPPFQNTGAPDIPLESDPWGNALVGGLFGAGQGAIAEGLPGAAKEFVAAGGAEAVTHGAGEVIQVTPAGGDQGPPDAGAIDANPPGGTPKEMQ
ncbi:MAG: hypothetical protein ACJ8BW_35315 [Ktedonobacteraceae bacterium]